MYLKNSVITKRAESLVAGRRTLPEFSDLGSGKSKVVGVGVGIGLGLDVALGVRATCVVGVGVGIELSLGVALSIGATCAVGKLFSVTVFSADGAHAPRTGNCARSRPTIIILRIIAYHSIYAMIYSLLFISRYRNSYGLCVFR